VVAGYAAGATTRLALFGARAGGAQLTSFYAQQPWMAWALGALWLLVMRAAFLPLWTQAGDAVQTRLRRACAGLAALLMFTMVSPALTTQPSHLVMPVTALIWGAPLALLLAALPEPRLLSHRHAPLVAGVIAAGWYFTVSYARHYRFGSGSKDMGLFLQSVWLLSRGMTPDNTVMGMNAFADHMELIDVFIAPLLWLWSDAGMLLLVQAVAAGSGAIPVYRMARDRLSPLSGALCAAAYFLAFEIANGVQFDWNPTTLSIGFFPWAFEAALLGKYRRMAVFLVVIGLCKENLLLYVAGFGTLLAAMRAPPRVVLATIVIPAVAFVVEIKLLFPMFREDGFRHFYFKELGDGFGDVIMTAISSPARAAALLFTPAQKTAGLLLPLTSTAFLGLLAPSTLLPMLPGMLERYWSTFQNSWWGHHYGGPTHALAICGAVLGGMKLRDAVGGLFPSERAQRAAALLPGLLMVLSTGLVDSVGPWGPTDLFAIRKPYHPAVEDRLTMRAAVASIPDGAPVAAQNYMLPHLAARPKAYMLERAREADFVAMTPTTNPWPYDRGFHERLAQELLGSGWRVHFCEGNSFVLSRTPGNSVPCPVLGR